MAYDTPLAGKLWKSLDEIYQYLFDRNLLPGETELSLMPVTWLNKHDSSENVGRYLCYQYDHGDWNAQLVTLLSKYEVMNPVTLTRQWKNADIVRILRHHGRHLEEENVTLDQLIDNYHVLKNKKDKNPLWHRLLEILQGGDHIAICRFIESMINSCEANPSDSHFEEIADLLPRTFREFTIPLMVGDLQLGRNVDDFHFFLFHHGTPEQKSKIAHWARRRDLLILKKISNGSQGASRGFLARLKTAEQLARIETTSPGYSERMGKEYVACCINPDKQGQFKASLLQNRLKTIKENNLVEGCADWFQDTFPEHWQTCRQWLDDNPFVLPEIELAEAIPEDASARHVTRSQTRL